MGAEKWFDNRLVCSKLEAISGWYFFDNNGTVVLQIEGTSASNIDIRLYFDEKGRQGQNKVLVGVIC